MRTIRSALNLLVSLLLGVLALAPLILAQSASTTIDSEVKRGAFNITFNESSPLSAADLQSQRYHIKIDAAQKYDLREQSFEAYVPADYPGDGKPYGLLVWIGAGDNGAPPRGWRGILDAHHLIGIGANGSGNEKGLVIRLGLALDAVHNIRKLYQIDENRIYASGVSGGGKVAGMLATIYPDAFSGALTIVGVTYFRNIPVSNKPGSAWEGSFAKPGNALLDRAKRNRFVLMTGSNDFNRDAIRDTYKEGFLRDGFRHVQYVEIPDQGHGAPSDTKWIDEAITTLDAPLTEVQSESPTQAKPPSNPATRPAEAAPAVASDDESAAARMLSLAENYQSNGLRSKAIERLEMILKDYPSTKAAIKAKALLARLKAP